MVVSFLVTRECNARCKHCYSDSVDSPHPDELSTSEAKRVIEEIAGIGTPLLLFDGGEPLLRQDIYEFISHAKELGLDPVMSTNATLLSTEVAERLKKAGIEALAISLDGADAKTHDEFRGTEGSWQRAMAGIHNAATSGIPFAIVPCIHRYNLAQLAAIAKKAKDSGAKGVGAIDFIPVRRGKKNAKLALSGEERQHVVEEIIQYQLDDNEMAYHFIAIPQYWVKAEKTVPQETMLNFARTCCGAGLRYCCISYQGTVYPCVLLQKSSGNIREQSLQEIWYESETFKILRDRDQLEGKCGRCDYRYVCGGARCKVYEATGSLTKEDQSCWFEEGELRRWSLSYGKRSLR